MRKSGTSLKQIFLIGSLSLLLTGCDKDFATLDFETSVYPEKSYEGVRLIYREQLDALLLDLGLNPGQVSIRADEKGRELVLSTPLFSGLEPVQQQQLKASLDQLVSQREQGMTAEFILRPKEVSSDRSEYLEHAATLPVNYPVNLQVKKTVVGVNYSLRSMLSSAIEGEKKQISEASCNAVMAVEPTLPFYAAGVTRNEAGEVTGFTLAKNYRSSYSHYDIPVDVRVNQPGLQAQLDAKKLYFSTQLTQGGNRFKRGTIKEMELYLGSLGEVEHENRKVSYYTKVRLEERCRKMAAELGRPFSFTMGDSLDRLTATRFY